MFRPATFGTILALAAAVLLALVTVNTPIIKSIYFLQATISSGSNGSGSSSAPGSKTATFGTLGYCIDSTCSKPALGYEFDPNGLLGISYIPRQYTGLAVKGLTYTLVLHPVACAISIVAVLLGILAHCSEMAMGCLGACATGTAAGIALIAFGLDLALFLIAKKRIESINGGSAQLGSALWLTVAAWVLLALGGCTFGCGMCGGGSGGRKRRGDRGKDSSAGYGQRPMGNDYYAERMRMDALEAEADRKRRQNDYDRNAKDLPKFAEYVTEHEIPLKDDYEDSPADAVRAPAAGLAGAGAHAAPSHAGYSDPYNQAVTGYAYSDPHNVPANVPGVGEGYGRRQPSQPQGYTHYPEPSYTPGIGPQPYRDGLESGGEGEPGPRYFAPQPQYPAHGAEPSEYSHGTPYAPARTPSAVVAGDFRSPSAAPSQYARSYHQHQYSAGHRGYSSQYDQQTPLPPMLQPLPPPEPHQRNTSREHQHYDYDSMHTYAYSGSHPIHRAADTSPDDHAARAAADDFGLDAIITSPSSREPSHALLPTPSTAPHGHTHAQSVSHYTDAMESHDPMQPPGYSSAYGHSYMSDYKP
ncbi:pali-domain-containing protein [Tilletiaria anomala UBC 951]|uniref:Pali-domain-containing protein n=1 Tax=Tilletiaria anomala (strain ATCC 24038 / CBS 436.72 / UBC 951) TaxID=1037660 RepID=A0A066VRN8_TILAU|nr:pali-domain-containing protein [Tilletiaria anomala UBC 951]KDN44362.1 pali-domain-containing protein [Tilletiaria anomala UBC 951]